jgi:DNA-binding transcriptional MerR regulator
MIVESRLMRIGEMARRAGVSVQTLRHYGVLGLLTPSCIGESGYRYYSDADYARLELIRALRTVGLDLATIGRLLEGRQALKDTLALHLETLELQRQAIMRQQIVLQAALEVPEDALLSRLHHLQLLAALDQHGRERFLSKQLGFDPETPRGSPAVWEAAIMNIPEPESEAQLFAWLELAELSSDPEFQTALEEQLRFMEGTDEAARQQWETVSQRLMQRALQAVQAAEPATGESARILVNEWMRAFAKVAGGKVDKGLVSRALDQMTTSDPRFERYWQLIATLKGWPYDDRYIKAQRWLTESLQYWRRHTKPD